jgi:signal transduction histidine kinase
MKYILLLFYIFFTYEGLAQDLATLKRQLPTIQSPEKRLKLLETIIKAEPLESPDFLGYQQEILQLAQTLKQPYVVLKARKSIAEYYGYQGNFDAYLSQNIEIAKLAEELNDPDQLLTAYHGIAQAFVQINKFEQAQKYIDLAFKNIEKYDKKTFISNFLEQQAFIFYFKKDYQQTLKLHFEALQYARQYNQKIDVADVLTEIGLTYIQLNEPRKAVDYMNQALGIYQQIQKKDISRKISFVYSDLGLAYSQLNQHQNALDAFQRCLSMVRITNDKRTEMETYRYLSEHYHKIKKHKEENLYLVKYYSIKDSLYNNDNRLKMMDLESKFSLEKKNIQIAQREAEKEKYINQRNIFILVALVALLLVSLLTYFYQKIKAQNYLIAQQKDDLSQLNQIKNRLFAILGHDLRTPMISLRTYFELASNVTLPEETRQKYVHIILDEVNRVSHLMENLLAWAGTQIRSRQPTLVPVSLQSLVAVVGEQVQAQAEAKGIMLEWILEKQEITTDRVILEIALRNLLTNAIKYSHHEQVVKVYSSENEIHALLSVIDQGTGMSPETVAAIRHMTANSMPGTQAEKGTGTGLYILTELLKPLNADLIIDSQLGKGTTMTLRFRK